MLKTEKSGGWLTTADLSKQLKVSAATVRKLARDGFIKPIKLGRHTFRFKADDVDKQLACLCS